MALTNQNAITLDDISGTSASATLTFVPASQAILVFVASTGLGGATSPPGVVSVTDTKGSVYQLIRHIAASNTNRQALGGPWPVALQVWGTQLTASGNNTVTVTLDTSCNPGQDFGPWAGALILGAYSSVATKQAIIQSSGPGTAWTSGSLFYDTATTATGSTGLLYGYSYIAAGVNLNLAGSTAYAPGGGGTSNVFSTLTLRTGTIVNDAAGASAALGTQAGWNYAGAASPQGPALAIVVCLQEGTVAHYLPILGVGK